MKFDAARRVKEIENSLQQSPASRHGVTEVIHETVPRETQRQMGCQTDLSFLQIREKEQCIQNMTSEVVELKKKAMEADLTEESFQASEEKTKFYTVIANFPILKQIISICSPYIFSGSSNILTKFQELILVLMRLHLNMPFKDLAFRFGISKPTASRIFDKWIDVLNVRLNFLIIWPERKNLREAMPIVFKQNFEDRVAVIRDCFEVFINKPSTLQARAIIWSNYKHHNTIKFLIGITPQGVISFISKAWGDGQVINM